ncbi:efflux RND transporter periplasmic adaptor subunit [Thermosulfurimonas sp. F29]|uniref:efflux RND transporter periplasmic adaptor subunit n=1 Tax=Thermosulfurimonas sp. F29 TaxID=2867247 RepID=UPI001C83305E|nr:efflux RND transporter periplasmic adaptor subunit [Thermosulfurimonas sp. F29]MBX6422835.1 efflux RND transporter periplasmic adaptor subunit [Thermosulfurimonas sp. F29]
MPDNLLRTIFRALLFFLIIGAVEAAAEPPLFIRISFPERRNFRRTVPFVGRVLPRKRVRITAPMEGRIISIGAPDESPVRAGMILFVLGGPEVEKRLANLKSQVAVLEKEISLAEEAVRLKREGVRAKIIPYGELLNAEEHLLQLENELGARRSELHFLKIRVRIRAPISGVFTRRRVSVGQRVKKGAVLAEILDPKTLWIRAMVFPPEGIGLCDKPAIIRLGGRTISARVTKVAPERTPAGGRVVFLEGKDIAGFLGPGEAVSGEIIIEEHRKALAVPEEALVYDESGKAYVFVKSEKGFEKRMVKTGLSGDGFVEVVSGLREGEKVVVEGAYELFYRNFSRIYRVPD